MHQPNFPILFSRRTNFLSLKDSEAWWGGGSMSAAIRCAEVLNIDKNSLFRSKRREDVNCVSDLSTTQYMETSNNRKR